jgi:tetratricopeptide (TPR) repeat protein
VVAAALQRAPDDVNDALDDLLERQTAQGVELIEECGGLALEAGAGVTQQLWRYRFTSPWHWLASRAALSERERDELAARLVRALAELYAAELWRVAPALAELSRLIGNPQEAVRYQRIADFAGPNDELRWEAQRILQSDVQAWDGWESERAAMIMLQACHQLRYLVPLSEARAYPHRAGQLGVRAKNGVLQAESLLGQGHLELQAGEPRDAREYLESAVRVARDVSYRQGEAAALSALGHLEKDEGEYHEAESRYRAALSLFRTLGDVEGTANVHLGLGFLAIKTGNLESALADLGSALNAFREAESVRGRVNALLGLVHANVYSGRGAEAGRAYREALRVERDGGQPPDAHLTLTFGLAASHLGDLAAARGHLTQAVRLATSVENDLVRELARRELVAIEADAAD